MILAVAAGHYDLLELTGQLELICDEIRTGDVAALQARLQRGELIQAQHAERHPRGERDRCYMPACGDEVTPCERHDGARYFRHLTNRQCIGRPGNPAGAHQ